MKEDLLALHWPSMHAGCLYLFDSDTLCVMMMDLDIVQVRRAVKGVLCWRDAGTCRKPATTNVASFTAGNNKTSSTRESSPEARKRCERRRRRQRLMSTPPASLSLPTTCQCATTTCVGRCSGRTPMTTARERGETVGLDEPVCSCQVPSSALDAPFITAPPQRRYRISNVLHSNASIPLE